MSRIGKKIIKKESNIEVSLGGGSVSVKGPKGSLQLALVDGISLVIGNDSVEVLNVDQNKNLDAKHGLFRALIVNMIKGVSEGFYQNLEIIGVGYKAVLQGKTLLFSLGFSHPVQVEPPAGIVFSMEGQTKIKVSGIDKELVGQVAADIRALKPPDVYKGKGIRYEAEFVKKKQGKSVKK